MAVHPKERPLVAVLGGAKVSDKIEVIQALLDRVDSLLIGGGMAYTFFRAKGFATGKSLVEEDKVALAAELLKKGGSKIVLPTDHVVASRFAADAESKTLPAQEVPEGWMGLDIGPDTRRAYADRVAGGKVIVWNGPMGVFEIDKFAAGTNAVAKAVASVKGTTIIGGGDSIAAIKKAGLADRITHISTGGGASLEFLGGRTLPGVAALSDK
jgi:phosphoglycerate kinase